MGTEQFTQLLNPEHQYNAWKKKSFNIFLSFLSADFLFISKKNIVSKFLKIKCYFKKMTKFKVYVGYRGSSSLASTI